jgi:hypothetical protein
MNTATSNQSRKNEFLSLTDSQTGESIFLDPSLIAYIQQEKGDGDTPGSHVLLCD